MRCYVPVRMIHMNSFEIVRDFKKAVNRNPIEQSRTDLKLSSCSALLFSPLNVYFICMYVHFGMCIAMLRFALFILFALYVSYNFLFIFYILRA